MPGVYAADFNAPPGRAGLMLPFTPTTGRIELGVDTGNLKEVGQDQPLFFIAGQLAGAFTRHAGECSIYIIAEWTGTNWGCILFNHLGGSYWDLPNNLEAVKRFSMSVDKNSCYSAVLGTSRFNAVCVAEALLQNKFPAQKMSVYIAGADVIDAGFVVENGNFGEIPPYRGGRASSSQAYGDLRTFSDNFSKF